MVASRYVAGKGVPPLDEMEERIAARKELDGLYDFDWRIVLSRRERVALRVAQLRERRDPYAFRRMDSWRARVMERPWIEGVVGGGSFLKMHVDVPWYITEWGWARRTLFDRFVDRLGRLFAVWAYRRARGGGGLLSWVRAYLAVGRAENVPPGSPLSNWVDGVTFHPYNEPYWDPDRG